MRSYSYGLSITLLSAALLSCSGGVVTGASESQKQPNPDKAGATGDSNPSKDQPDTEETETDATPPQVVTGSYLACVLDKGAALPNETGYGCGLYDDKTNQKLPLGAKVLTLTASTSAGSALVARQEADSDTSKFHSHLYVNGTSQRNIVVNAVLSGGGSAPVSYTTRTISAPSSGARFNPADYSTGQISVWCQSVTSDLKSESISSAEKDLACGPKILAGMGGVCANSKYRNHELNAINCAAQRPPF